MPEQFAFEQARGNRGAIQFDSRALAVVAGTVLRNHQRVRVTHRQLSETQRHWRLIAVAQDKLRHAVVFGAKPFADLYFFQNRLTSTGLYPGAHSLCGGVRIKLRAWAKRLCHRRMGIKCNRHAYFC